MKRLPEPYWQSSDGGIVLYHADCMKILPLIEKGSVDAVVTDPPYGVNLNTDNSRFSWGTKGNIAKRGNGIGTANGEPIAGDDKPFDPRPLLRIGRRQIIWGFNNFSDKLPAGACLVWVKRNFEAFGSFLSDAETAWFSHGRGVYCNKDLSNNAITNERSHPTQKPVALMGWCIEKASKQGQTILDPFAGSCTTGVAAIRTGRKCILIEKEEKYCAIGAKRLAEACCEGEGQFKFPEPDLFSTV